MFWSWVKGFVPEAINQVSYVRARREHFAYHMSVTNTLQLFWTALGIARRCITAWHTAYILHLSHSAFTLMLTWYSDIQGAHKLCMSPWKWVRPNDSPACDPHHIEAQTAHPSTTLEFPSKTDVLFQFFAIASHRQSNTNSSTPGGLVSSKLQCKAEFHTEGSSHTYIYSEWLTDASTLRKREMGASLYSLTNECEHALRIS